MQAYRHTPSNADLRFHDIPGPGTPLVFVHGLGCASSCDYPRVIADPALARRRFILVDLLGSGFSDRPADFNYAIEAHASTLLDLFDSLQLERIDLFGHSMGGAVAISTAGLQPERIRRLVLAEPNLDNGGGTFSRGIAAWSEADYVAFGHAEQVKTAKETGNSIWAGSMALSSPTAIYRNAASLVQGCNPTWREILLSLSMPRTVIFGQRSLPDPDTDALPAEGVSVGYVPDAGHSMMWENPTGLALAIEHALSTPDTR